MKVIILAGGLGTRISEESHLKPKPMIEIGEQPILWHIMKYFSTFKFNEFIILAGYKQNKIKEYFANYFVYNSDVTFYMVNNSMEVHHKTAENWKVTVLDTGLNTMTGGRVKRAKEYIGNEPFMLTYGDGVADVDLDALQDFHSKHGKIATITTVSLAQQKGVLEKEENGLIRTFREKSIDDAAMINGGYMLLNPEIFNYIEDDMTVFEQSTLNKLAEEEQLMGFEHDGFWQCMDTQREKEKLERLWAGGKAPWKRWND
ncbi:MAG: glucose-1-phosphate cytidylyltransferase [Lachnospiraceae bacterium]|nr:glucose-1-phosphate cytidylyltransferase [Lachnospiraceae bacterium]